ncbi:MAG: ArsR/SmtB family transcription factor [Bacteroidia bacterium]
MNALTNAWSAPQKEVLTRTLKAIAHPTRLAIIDMLEGGRKMTVTEIHTTLEADQSSVSHHLSIMRDRGVLHSERRGKHIYYSLRHQAYLSLIDCLSRIHSQSDVI